MAAPTVHIQVGALPPAGVANFDPRKAVDAYLSRVSGKAKARSDAYFEGGYVLSAVDLIYTLAIAGLLLFFRISAKMRDIAASITRSRFWQAPIYVVQYVVVMTLAGLPLTFYEGFLREHAYGLSNQSFSAWAGLRGKPSSTNPLRQSGCATLDLISPITSSSGTSWPRSM